MTPEKDVSLKQVKKTEELTKAVLALTERFKKNEELANKTGVGGSIQRGTNLLASTAKEKISDMFSAKGAAKMLGFKQDGMIMNMLGARHDAKKEAKVAKAEEAAKAKSYAENYMKYNVEGQELAKTDPKAALKAGVKSYEAVKKKQEEIDKLKEEIAQAEKTGHGDIAKQTHGAALAELERQQKTITTGKEAPAFAPPKGTFKAKPQTTPEASTEPAYKGNTDIIESLIALGYSKQEANSAAQELPPEIGVSDGIKAAMKALSKEPDKSKTGTPAVSKSTASSVITPGGGADTPDEALVEINKQQLEALNKLVEADIKSKEDKLEEDNKDQPGMPADTKPKDKKEDDKGIFSGLLEGLISKTMNIGKIIGSGVGAIATSGIGKLIGVGGAKAGGAKAGGEAAAKTGEKVVGKELAKTGAKGLGKSLLKKLPGIGLLAGIGFAASRMMDGDYVGAGLEIASGAASVIPGIGTAASVGIDAGLAARDMGMFDGDTVVSPEMSKPATTSREAQIAQLDRTQKQAERIEREKADAANNTAPASAVVNNNTSVNNSTTVTKIQAPVRNFEPSFNRRLDYAFGGGIATVGVRG